LLSRGAQAALDERRHEAATVGSVGVHIETPRMFDYPDDGYSEVFLQPDIALRQARQILARLELTERTSEPQPHRRDVG